MLTLESTILDFEILTTVRYSGRSNGYIAKTINDSDYVDDLALLVDTPVQTKSLGQSLELTAKAIGLYWDSNEIDFVCFKLGSAIS